VLCFKIVYNWMPSLWTLIFVALILFCDGYLYIFVFPPVMT